MADYNVTGTKIIRCRKGHYIDVPFQQTVAKCEKCGEYVLATFHGAVIDKYGNYVY